MQKQSHQGSKPHKPATMNRAGGMPQPLIWINGWPAVGKRTVAQCLAALLGPDRAVLIDDTEFTDHLDLPPDEQQDPSQEQQPMGGIVTPPPTSEDMHPTGSKTPVSSCSFVDMTAKQATCFEKYVQDPAAHSRVVLFTDCRVTDIGGAAGARAYQAAARRAGRPFVPVYMECAMDENLRRTQTTERRYSQTSKRANSGGGGGPATALRALRALRAEGRQLYRFPSPGPDTEDDSGCVEGLSVDVTKQGAHESAMQILGFMNDVSEQFQRKERKPT